MKKVHGAHAGFMRAGTSPGALPDGTEAPADAVLLTLVACAGLAALLLSLATRLMG